MGSCMDHRLLMPRRRNAAADWVAQLLAHSPIALYAADRGVYSDAGTTLAVNSDPVRQWNDQSGNGYHLSQATLGLRPTLNTTGGPSSLPTLVFDGSDDFMLTAGSLATFPSKRGLAIAVYKNTAASGVDAVCSTYVGVGVDWEWTTVTAVSMKNYWYDGVGSVTGALYDAASTFILKSMWRDGDTTLKHRRNAAAADSMTITNNQPASNPLAVGANTVGTENLTGSLSMVALFGDKTQAQVEAIEAIINTKFAVY